MVESRTVHFFTLFTSTLYYTYLQLLQYYSFNIHITGKTLMSCILIATKTRIEHTKDKKYQNVHNTHHGILLIHFHSNQYLNLLQSQQDC